MMPIYMDHHATTPVHPEVLDGMMPFFREEFGNPASVTHSYGRGAAAAVETARESIAVALGIGPKQIIFTSGATESNNLALRGAAEAALERAGSAHVVTCAVEHRSILDTALDLERRGIAVTVLPVDEDGRVDPDAVRGALRPDTCLVSIQMANSEIGTLQPVQEIGVICREARVPFHTDAAQAVGRLPIDLSQLPVDLLSLSGHKIYGPKGIGALYCARQVRLRPQIMGGGHERNRRSGTLNVPAIAGMASALDVVLRDRNDESARLAALRDRLWAGISSRILHARRNGHATERLPNNLNVSFREVEGESLLMAVRDFALSSGSACTSGETGGSYVIGALGVGEEATHTSIRFGLGRSNTEEQVDRLVDSLEAAVRKLRAISTAGEREPGTERSHASV